MFTPFTIFTRKNPRIRTKSCIFFRGLFPYGPLFIRGIYFSGGFLYKSVCFFYIYQINPSRTLFPRNVLLTLIKTPFSSRIYCNLTSHYFTFYNQFYPHLITSSAHTLPPLMFSKHTLFYS